MGISHSNVINNINGSIRTFSQNNQLNSTSSAKIEIDYCPAPVSTFLGRSEELVALKTLLSQHQMVALVGMGGLGKTQLSRKYGQVNKADYQYRYWLESETPEKLKNSFKDLAKILNIESDNINKVVNDVYKKIQAVPTILVFDNVEKPADVYDYLPTRVDLPSGVTIHVLVTSRWTEWTCDEQIECYNLQPMDISTSLQIFQRKFGQTCLDTMQNEWEKLAAMLGYLPLALQVATSYIYKRNKHGSDLSMALADYMKQLKEGADALLNNPLPEYGNRSVYVSMMLTLQQLEYKVDNVSNVQSNVQWKIAVTIINAVAYMNPDKIDKDDLLKLVDNHENICKLDEALAILTEYSLLNQGVGWRRTTIYSVHRIIQSSVRHNQILMGTADMYYIRVLKYAFAKHDFPYDVAQYINERAAAVAVYYKNNPSPRILDYLVENKAINAMEAVLKLISQNQIQIAMKEHDLLFRAVDSKNLGMTELLRKYGGNITINQPCRKWGYPPLHCALKWRNVEITTWLLENGALSTVQDRDGRNALHVAVKYANHKMVPILIKSGADITAVDKYGYTVLHLAAEGARAAAVSLILQLNKDLINIENKFGETALHVIPFYTTSINDERILSTIRVLAESGVDFTKKDCRGGTVLQYAAEGARVAAVSLILQLNKDLINIENKYGETVLHVIHYDNRDIDDECILSTIRVLAESGVDFTKVQMRGETVLHYAAEAPRAAVVSLILQLHKDLIHIKNKDSQTALHVLGNDRHDKLKHCTIEERKQLFAETARVLIMNGLSLDTRDNKGRTPLDTVKREVKDVLLAVAEECINR